MEGLLSWIHANAICVSATILIVAYVFIATEKIPKVTVALLGGALTLLLGLLGQSQKVNGVFDPHYFINFVDFNVIFLLVSMMIVVHIAAQSGMFTWVANEILKQTKGKPKLVLAALAVFTAVASAFLDNVTTVILIMPITFAACKLLEINPIPFLITEVFCSNIGGTATLIGDPPNIIIGSAAGFSFMDFVRELTLPVCAIMLVVVALLVFIYRKDLKSSPEKMELVSKMRASSYLMGTTLARFGSVSIAFPGGCNFGVRPLDLHFKGFEDMGASFSVNKEKIDLKVNKRLKCSKITLDKISVGATINMIMHRFTSKKYAPEKSRTSSHGSGGHCSIR